MVVPPLKSRILTKIYEGTVNIVQLYNLAKLRKWKHKYTIQVLKVECLPLHNLFWQAPHMPPHPPLKWKKCQPLSKTFLRTKKSSPHPHSLGEEDTMNIVFSIGSNICTTHRKQESDKSVANAEDNLDKSVNSENDPDFTRSEICLD